MLLKRLPCPNCGACLIATAEGLAVAGYYGNGVWVLDYDELNIECEVTHWRELPEEWVDAGEKLPPEDEDKKAYLVKVGGNVTIAEYYGDGEWMTYSLCNVTRLVTHWQELPKEKRESTSQARGTAERAHEAAIQAGSKWQTVSETLPSHEMYVLGFDAKKQLDYPYLHFYPDTQKFYDEMYPEKPVKITHWMPFPDAPKEGEKQ